MNLCIPFLIKGTLKLMRYPNCFPVNFRWLMICACHTGFTASIAFISTITSLPTNTKYKYELVLFLTSPCPLHKRGFYGLIHICIWYYYEFRYSNHATSSPVPNHVTSSAVEKRENKIRTKQSHSHLADCFTAFIPLLDCARSDEILIIAGLAKKIMRVFFSYPPKFDYDPELFASDSSDNVIVCMTPFHLFALRYFICL